jgi:hypothetical protein
VHLVSVCAGGTAWRRVRLRRPGSRRTRRKPATGSILPGLQFVNRRVLAGHADAPADPVPVGDQGPRGLRLHDERYITGLNFGRRGAPRE